MFMRSTQASARIFLDGAGISSFEGGSGVSPGAGEVAKRLLVQALRAEKSARLQVQGRSMEPLMRGGDWVEVLPPALASRGSVVLALNGDGHLICHRMIARVGGTAWLAGDRSPAVEELALENVLGVVTSVDRGGRVLRLDGSWARYLDRLVAGLHQLSSGPRRSILRGVPNVLRKVLIRSRAFVWKAGDAARLSRSGGTSCLRRPASSR